MEKTIGIAGLCILLSVSGLTQTSVSRTYIKGGKDAWNNYLHEIYLNPAFEKGVVEYKNGQRFKSSLNYNRVLGAIQFIDEKNDTLVLNNDDKSVSSVMIGATTFFMDPVCLEKIAGNSKASLARNEKARQADKQKVGAMGIPNSSGTIDSYDRTYSRNNHYIDIDEQLLIRKTTNFYMSGFEGRFVLASKRNVLGLFPDLRKQISSFIDEKQIDFNKEADLLTLTKYIGTL